MKLVNIDYILNLIKQYHDKHILDKEVPADITRAISSNPELKPKKEIYSENEEEVQDEENVENN